MDLDSIPYLGQLPTEAIREKHLPSGRASYKPKAYRRTRNHIIRSTAKHLAETNNPNLCQELNLPCTGFKWEGIEYSADDAVANPAPSARRMHIEEDLRTEYAFQDYQPDRSRVIRTRDQWGFDELEGKDLARSAVALPSDRNRIVRRPTLEREDAFRDANTCKANNRQRRNGLLGEDAEIAELYRLGLLYDNEQDRGEGFNLNSISHDAPLYSVRPSRRLRRSNKAKGYGLNPLHLDLSFTDLGDNDAIAQYLMSSTAIEFSGSDDAMNDISEQPHREFAPLRVIYEVDSSSPSFDVDTSQPPDLVSDDFISDYDCFSDSDLDDLPSQREVRDSAATPTSDAWVVLGDDS